MNAASRVPNARVRRRLMSRALFVGLGVVTLMLPIAILNGEAAGSSPPRPDGPTVYAAYCSMCHGSDGQGAERAGPPLAHNRFVTGDPRAVIRVVIHGMKGAIRINGRPWGNGSMPGFQTTLTPAQTAAVLTFIRSSWGNRASLVNERDVADR